MAATPTHQQPLLLPTTPLHTTLPHPALKELKIIDDYQICHSRQPSYSQEDQSGQMDGIKLGSVGSLEKKASIVPSFLTPSYTLTQTKRAVPFIYYQKCIPVRVDIIDLFFLFDRFHVSTEQQIHVLMFITIF